MWRSLRIAHFLGEGGEKRRVPYISKPRQLRMLAKSKDAGMRMAVARSKYTTLEILEVLAKDESWPVRMAVAWHEKISMEILVRLLQDHEKPVYEAAARHPLYTKFLQDAFGNLALAPKDPQVALLLSGIVSPVRYTDFAKSDNWWVRTLYAQKIASSDKSLLWSMRCDKDECVRTAVASNSWSEGEILECLAYDESECVRGAVAGNKNTPLLTLCHLAKDASSDVRERVRLNPATPANLCVSV